MYYILTPGGYFHYRKQHKLGAILDIIGSLALFLGTWYWYVNFTLAYILLFSFVFLLVSINMIRVIIEYKHRADPMRQKGLEQDFSEILSLYLQGNSKPAFERAQKLSHEVPDNTDLYLFTHFVASVNSPTSDIVETANELATQEPSKSLFYFLKKRKVS